MLYHTYGLSNSQQHGQMGKSVISTTFLTAWSGINPHPGIIVVSLHKTLNNDCLCLSALNKQKTQQTRIWRNSLEHWIYENSKTGANSSKHKVANAIKSVRIIPQLASDAVRWQEDKYVQQQLILPFLKKIFCCDKPHTLSQKRVQSHPTICGNFRLWIPQSTCTKLSLTRPKCSKSR